jgi:hypothetical protein
MEYYGEEFECFDIEWLENISNDIFLRCEKHNINLTFINARKITQSLVREQIDHKSLSDIDFLNIVNTFIVNINKNKKIFNTFVKQYQTI